MIGVLFSFFAALPLGLEQGRAPLVLPSGRASSPVSRAGLASKYPIARLSQSEINGIVAAAKAGSSADPVAAFSARSLVVPGWGSMELSRATHVDPVDDRVGFRIEVPPPGSEWEGVVMQAPNLSGIDPKMPSVEINLDHPKKNATYLVVANLWSKNAKGHFVSSFATSDLALPSGAGNLPILLTPKAKETSFTLWFEPIDAKKLSDIVVSSIEIQEVK